MILLLQILSAIALIAFTALIIKLIKSLNRAEVMMDKTTKYVEEISTDFKELSVNANEAFSDLKEIKARMYDSLDRINKFTGTLNDISHKGSDYFDDLRNLTKPYENLVKDAYPVIAAPVNKSLSVINALKKALTVFKQKLNTKKL